MKVKFQADADFNQWVIAALKRRESGVGVRTAHEAGLAGLTDPEVLYYASRQGRVLLPHDRRTMPRHFAEFLKTSNSPGVIIVSQGVPAYAVAEELYLIWSASEAKEWADRICTVPL